ncbi:tyrosine-protein phosphatase non-receptor type 14 [Protopterus annectens]|uniref:tyrosine-protein phosphatase non-receptor type 14 n=1 Tax=Protopterus annectens TaxID=7888 RepID=UPI001CF9AD9E|nr:tyrosine-protein phosphatase non-receptor type 14 [Protopterus annectens]
MPFRIKLRRTRRYNVLSKNCFVTRIRLLDNSVIECTLSVESTGQECLEAVAQRLELRETHYFGLWFKSKNQQPRWVELEKALKKQLDKFANEPLLFFGVMFYVPNVSQLQQEATRYQYYLQVKKDLLDGRLLCSVDHGIRLAGLAVQAEFGDHIHFDSQDSLKEYVLFPMGWVNDEAVLEELTQKVTVEHKANSGMPTAEAEFAYTKEVEQLDGFGEECFPAKDNIGNDVQIGVSFMGIFIKYRTGRPTTVYRWSDIGTFTHNKSTFAVELTSKEETIPFHVEDMEMAKYLSRLFTAKQKFYKQNKMCTEHSTSPEPVRRRPTWSRSSMPRQQPFILPPVHVSYGEHYTETHTSQDSIFHGNEEGFYYRSQTSLDRYPGDCTCMNGTVPNGSVYSAPSMNSLNHSQNFIQASPMSSNLSIPGSDIMRPDYIPSHRHSTIIVPSYRPTPDYDTVMRQMKRSVYTGRQSQSLRNLNIGNTHAYNHPEGMVYSQPEIRERSQYPASYGPQVSYSKPVAHSVHMKPNTNNCSSSQCQTAASAISHTVSTPELANTQPQGTQNYSTAHMLKNHFSRPPPPYPSPRPATSTPDLASHRHRYVSGSSPDLVTRKVQLSVKTFQEDSSPVVHQSLQEVSEPLTVAKHHAVVSKRHSFEVISTMVRGMEAIALKTFNAPLPRRNTLCEQLQTNDSVSKPQECLQPSHYHNKTLSDATVLIHSSESEEEETPEYNEQIVPPHETNMDYSAQLQAALARIPNRPPPEYPGPRKSVSNGALRQEQDNVSRLSAREKAASPGQHQSSGLTRTDQLALNGPSLGPSISEPDLSTVKERVKKEPVKERPVSELFSIEDSIVEREIMLRNLEKQKLTALDAQKRPLMLAALNGLSVARVTLPEDTQDDTAKVPADERCRILQRKLEEDMVFTEYEQIPKKKPEGVFTTAALPENAERNRFRDVVPYEENRVELVPTKENNTGYVNASHVKVIVAGEQWHYIATQGPLPHTCHDFWQMVWEQGVNVIAMVTAEEEGGRSKSHRYWPKLGSKHSSATYGKFKVTTKFRTDSGCYATTGLKVKHLLSGQERTVWHLQYTDWPDHGCPEDVSGFLSYLEEIQSVRRHTNSVLDSTNNGNPPVVVHCSAGVGRTGVVILAELMICCLEHNQAVAVPTMLANLRQQRMLMVQTIAQYTFVYQVLIQFLRNSRLI